MTTEISNKWLLHKNYGAGEALAFVGDEKFVRRSLNFASCFLMSGKNKILHDGIRKYIMIKRGKLRRGLAQEGLSRAQVNKDLRGSEAVFYAVRHVKKEMEQVREEKFLNEIEKMR